jgi:hypothetical protein
MMIKVRKNYLALIVALLTGISIYLIFITFAPSHPFSKQSLKASPSPVAISPSGAIGNTEAYNTIKKVAEKDGVEAAWKYVIETYGKDNSRQLEAHDYSHYVGQLIFQKKGLTGITLCTADFAFGCYHGLLDQAFRNDISSLPQAEKACQQVGKAGSGPYASCVHGIGHGVASYFKDKDLEGALKTCDKLPQNAPQFCYDGVFMEFSRDALDNFYKASDLLYPCDTVDAKYTYQCGRNQPSVLMARFNKSYDEIAKACQKASIRDLKVACYTALGFQTVYNSDSNAEKIISKCESVNDKEFEYQCKSAAAGELIFQNMQGWQTNAPLICDSLDSNNKNSCHSYITGIQKNYNRT